MPIYMKYEGIKGTVTAKGEHNGWIELQSAQLGTNLHTPSHTGNGTNRPTGAVFQTDIVITKMQDSASPLLFQEAISGKGRTVTIDFVKTEKGKEVTYLSIEIKDAMISGYNISGHGGDSNARPMETLSVNFTKITYTAKPTVSDPQEKPIRAEWDLAVGGG